ncbi:GNAT family N-acetyltransferase [Actinoplanes couchii]|nr:GNAT family N-acetyltransferase [Actinoplanes couchii]
MGVTVGSGVSVAGVRDRERVVGTLVAAFVRDPVLRFLFPADADYAGQAGAFFGHLFDKRVHRKAIWTVEGGASVAIWEPPGGDEPVDAEVSEISGLSADARERVRRYDDAVHAAFPSLPFWYLGVLGTHPAAAGRRLGRVVMAEGLRRAAADGLPAYLETSRPENVEFYRRAGWEVVAEVSDPLPIWVMRQ